MTNDPSDNSEFVSTEYLRCPDCRDLAEHPEGLGAMVNTVECGACGCEFTFSWVLAPVVKSPAMSGRGRVA